MKDHLTVETKCDISNKEWGLIEALREISYGEVVIHIQEGQPVRIVRVSESIKL